MKAKAYIVHQAMCEPELKWSKPKDCLSAEPLFTAPPQRKPLTDQEMMRIYVELKSVAGFYSVEKFARAIEAAHGIKEGT